MQKTVLIAIAVSGVQGKDAGVLQESIMPVIVLCLICCLCLIFSVPAQSAESSMRSFYPALKADEDWLVPREIVENIPVFDSYEKALAGEPGERVLGRRAVACDTDAWRAIERRNGFVRGYMAGDPEEDGWVRESDFIPLETYLGEASRALEKEDGILRERLLYRGNLAPSVQGASVYMVSLPLVMGRSDTLLIRGADGRVLWAEEPPHPVEPDTIQVVPSSENIPEELAEEENSSDAAVPFENASDMGDETVESPFYTLELVADMDGDGTGEFIWTNTIEGDAEHRIRHWNGREFVTLIEGVYFGNRTSDPDAYAFMTEDEVFHSAAGADFPRLEAWTGVSEDGFPVAEIRTQGRAVFRFASDLQTARVISWESRISGER